MEITFYPGEERVQITQTAEGLDPENYLSIKTNIQGQVPYIPANFTAHIAPYKEVYHYLDSGMCSFDIYKMGTVHTLRDICEDDELLHGTSLEQCVAHKHV